MDQEREFAFISNVLDVRVQLPIQLTSRLRLDRATPGQIDRIRDVLSRFAAFVPTNHSYHYETENVPDGDGNFRPIRLEPDRMRYFGIAHDGRSSDVGTLIWLCQLCTPSLDSQISLIETFDGGELKGAGSKWNGDPYPDNDGLLVMREPQVLDADFEPAIREKVDLYGKLDTERHEGISRAIELFYKSKRVESTNFQMLAYFAVIEMLITHMPNNKEIGDSIRHQLLTKMPLLSERMPKGFAYEEFAGATPKKVWDALYSYRSDVAHGNKIDFRSKDLSFLGGPADANRFLRDATSKLLTQALREPDLVTSLKNV